MMTPLIGNRTPKMKRERDCKHQESYEKRVYENGVLTLIYCGKCGEILKKGDEIGKKG